MNYQNVRGTTDFLPEDAAQACRMEFTARDVLRRYGYAEIRLPILEHVSVFLRGLGETTDIVQKQLFRIEGKDEICLRPEGTAQVVRSCIQHNLFESNGRTRKLFYVGPMFRGERPQKGRLRQFHHIGVEAVGGRYAAIDAEVIKLAHDILTAFGLENGVHFRVELNSLGSAEDKVRLQDMLRGELASRQEGLCELCRQRFEKNVLRVLDCKNPECQKVVNDVAVGRDYLSGESRSYFDEVCARVTDYGIAWQDSERLVRGLDYYTHTVFEFTTTMLGAQSAIGAGGRYDNLVRELGGPDIPCCGFGLGLERIMLLLESDRSEPGLTVFVAHREQFEYAWRTVRRLRDVGIDADLDFTGASLKSQLKYSQKLNARYVVIVGEDEAARGTYTVRDMSESEQKEHISFDEILRMMA
jgi:histidyl-tRNA synthetase